jgi:hypothetical protein
MLEARILIALHSPYAILETGLRMCLPEKARTVTAFDAEESVLCSPVFGEQSRNTGIIRVFWRRVSGIALQSRLRGGEGGIRLPPFLASRGDSYT